MSPNVLWVLQRDAYNLFSVCAQNGSCGMLNDFSMYNSEETVKSKWYCQSTVLLWRSVGRLPDTLTKQRLSWRINMLRWNCVCVYVCVEGRRVVFQSQSELLLQRFWSAFLLQRIRLFTFLLHCDLSLFKHKPHEPCWPRAARSFIVILQLIFTWDNAVNAVTVNSSLQLLLVKA